MKRSLGPEQTRPWSNVPMRPSAYGITWKEKSFLLEVVLLWMESRWSVQVYPRVYQHLFTVSYLLKFNRKLCVTQMLGRATHTAQILLMSLQVLRPPQLLLQPAQVHLLRLQSAGRDFASTEKQPSTHYAVTFCNFAYSILMPSPAAERSEKKTGGHKQSFLWINSVLIW